MENLLKLFEIYSIQLSALGASSIFIFGVYKFLVERKETHYWKEFDTYHRLIKELVEPQAGLALYIDRQTAILFELRFYKRYYSHSLRMLKGLRQKWGAEPNQFPRIIEELDLTIEYINKKL